MSMEWLAELGWKSLLLSALTLVLLRLAERRSAAEKSLIGDAGLLALVLLPLAIAWLPRFELAPPAMVGTAVASLAGAPEYVAPAGLPETAAAVPASAALDWNAIILLVYCVPVFALLAGLAHGLLRLRRLRLGARMLEDGRWLSAAAAAQNRLGVRHGVALLTSEELSSPASWGVVRPIVMIDPAARAEVEQAEAIIAHELAHVQRLDWPRLLLARLVLALLWFNPLVWMLARQCHQLREEAADDAVLRSRIGAADYAALLLRAACQTRGARGLAANGVAPGGSSMARRIRHVLDGSRRRGSAPLTWVAATLGLGLAAHAALAASEPVLEPSHGLVQNGGERAAAMLASLPAPQARALADAIARRDWDARRGEGVTLFNEPRAVEPLMRALRDDDPTVRRIALWGLSEMRPVPEALVTPAISELLEDPSPAVRAEAAGALGDFESIANSRSIEKLLIADPVAEVRLRAAHALGDIQDPGSRAALERGLQDADARVRDKSRWALGQVAEAERLMDR